jgi:serine protease Do
MDHEVKMADIRDLFHKYRVIILLVLVTGFMAGLAGSVAGHMLVPATGYADTSKYTSSLDTAREIEAVFRNIAGKAVMSVVRIDTEKQAQGATVFQKGQTLLTFGSGIIIEQAAGKAWVLTNNHVATGASKLTVTLSDKSQLDAELVGFDERTDLAVLVIKTDKRLVPASIGSSIDVAVGDWAIGVGNPFGFDGSVTVGIVSALGRPFKGRADATDYIQTDAAINPGNSGGPLLNIEGEVIGINTWIASQTGANTGLSFSIPVDNAMTVYRKLKENRTVEYAWIGVGIKSLTDSTFRNSLGLDRTEGAYVTEVFEDSPADRAKLKVGDIIIGIDSYTITDANELVWTVSKYEPGTRITVTFYRGGRKKSVECLLGSRPSDNEQLSVKEDTGSVDFLGAGCSGIGMSHRQQFGLTPGQTGVIIETVSAGSPAAEYGLQVGDVITRINTYNIGDLAAFERFLEQSKADGVELFYCYLVRRGRELILGVQKQ